MRWSKLSVRLWIPHFAPADWSFARSGKCVCTCMQAHTLAVGMLCVQGAGRSGSCYRWWAALWTQSCWLPQSMMGDEDTLVRQVEWPADTMAKQGEEPRQVSPLLSWTLLLRRGSAKLYNFPGVSESIAGALRLEVLGTGNCWESCLSGGTLKGSVTSALLWPALLCWMHMLASLTVKWKKDRLAADLGNWSLQLETEELGGKKINWFYLVAYCLLW